MCPRRRTAPQKPGLEQRSSGRGVRVGDAGQQLGGAKAALPFTGVRTQQKPDSRPGKRLSDLPGRRTPPSRPPVCLCTAQPIGYLHILIRHHSTSAYLLGQLSSSGSQLSSELPGRKVSRVRRYHRDSGLPWPPGTRPRPQGGCPFLGSGFRVLKSFTSAVLSWQFWRWLLRPCSAAVACSSYEAPVAGRRCPAGLVAAAAAGCERVSGRVVRASHGR